MSIKIPLFNCYVGNTPPLNPVNGTMWFNPQENRLKIFVGGAWKDVVEHLKDAYTLQGHSPSYEPVPHTIPVRDSSGTIHPGSIPALKNLKLTPYVVNSSTTLTTEYSLIEVDTSNSNVILTLPPLHKGLLFIFKKLKSQNRLIIRVHPTQQGTVTIDDLSQLELLEANESVGIIGGSERWDVIF